MVRFAYWFENVFWYHYKWYWLFGVAALTFVVLLFADYVREVSYDWTVAYQGDSLSSDSAVEEHVQSWLTSHLPDQDGDGVVRVQTVPYWEFPDENRARPFLGALTNKSILLCALPERVYDKWDELGYFVASSTFAAIDGDRGRTAGNVGHYVLAVTDPGPELTDPVQAAALGMTQEEIDERDALARQRYAAVFEIAMDLVASQSHS